MANFRKSIDQAKGVQVKPIQVPQWPHVDDDGNVILDTEGKSNCTHYVRMLTLGEIQEFQKAVEGVAETNPVRCGSELLVRTLCDAEGNRLFQDSEAHLFDKQNWTACRIAAEAAQEFNGMEDKAAKN